MFVIRDVRLQIKNFPHLFVGRYAKLCSLSETFFSQKNVNDHIFLRKKKFRKKVSFAKCSLSDMCVYSFFSNSNYKNVSFD